ncbi:40S ribosomal protein S12 [Lucilia cuprina]|uniref:40S ribosomal protein S12 n=1 Tax=Lucilia cuprina TaxID=7375 RepID=A0A0L0BYB8_LUCCU|nr:40S ribosomal protein S12 [Lucilia cuprina]KNC25032.1 40S ribosomal protein S12 [Lucilia cuprina]
MADVDVDVPSAAPAVGGPMDINQVLQEVLKKSVIADGLVHGIHQACKALDKRQAVKSFVLKQCSIKAKKPLLDSFQVM